MRFLELKIPPPLVALAIGAGMWFLAGQAPSLGLTDGTRIAAAAVALALGLSVMLAGVVSFRRAKTTVNPLKPDTASALVTGGIYGYTRNPMYLGMLALLIAWAVFLSSPAAFAGPLVFWLYIGRFQILPEEKALRALFGDAFKDYTSKVRRWI